MTRLARKSSSQAATFRLRRSESFAWRPSDQVMGDVLDGGEICRGVLGSDAAFVVAEDHIHDPMEAVLDRPMAAHDRPQKLAGQDQRGDDRSVSRARPCRSISRMLSTMTTAFQAGPGMSLLEPGDIVDDSGGSGLDATVIAIDRVVAG